MCKWVGIDIENEEKREEGGERKDEIESTHTRAQTPKYTFLQKYMYAK